MEAAKNQDWKKLLQTMSTTINTRLEDNMIYYDKAAVKGDWLGFERTTLESIEAKEKSLGIAFPHSYREFLLTSNGFRQISLFAGNLCPVSEVGWLKDKDPEFIEIINQFDYHVSDEDYYVYGENQRAENLKSEYLKKTLQISEWVDGSVILLNPNVKFGEEWEAWIYANWYPGAHRYKSFRELIEDEFYATVEILDNPNRDLNCI
jgi:hypothetical protein